MNKFLTAKRTAVVYIIFLAAVVFSSYGYFAGISGRTKKDGFTKGCECHGSSPFSNVSVTISGPDTISPGQTVNFLLSITGGPLVRGGTDIAVVRGELTTIPGSGLRKLDGELTHEQPKAPLMGVLSFSFSYTAPLSEGSDTLFANGNSVNFDMLPYNDNWNYAANKILTIRKPIGVINISSSIPGSFKLYQNYPNPFNPSTGIIFDVPAIEAGTGSHNIKLSVYDVTGKEVLTPVNGMLSAGVYKAGIDASHLPSGIYFYRLSGGAYSETKKMMLVK